MHDVKKDVWAATSLGKQLARTAGELEGQVGALERRLNALAERVDEMTQTDEITAAVTAAIRQERHHLLSVPQRIGAVLLTLLVAVPYVHELVLWLG